MTGGTATRMMQARCPASDVLGTACGVAVFAYLHVGDTDTTRYLPLAESVTLQGDSGGTFERTFEIDPAYAPMGSKLQFYVRATGDRRVQINAMRLLVAFHGTEAAAGDAASSATALGPGDARRAREHVLRAQLRPDGRLDGGRQRVLGCTLAERPTRRAVLRRADVER
jgi:hypothetical protein